MKLQPKQLAVVTGASGGLGEQFARQLAAKGVDLVLVARSAAKLTALAGELSAAHGVTAQARPADLSDTAAVAALAGELFGPTARPVDLLVNNAGLGYHSPLAEQTDAQVAEMVAVNVDALVRLTRAAAAGMVARGSGAVLNIGSMAGFQPCPGLAVYAATKAFVMAFGEAVDYECRPRGVRVTTFCPGPTATGFAGVAGSPPKMFKGAPSAAVVAAKGLAAVEAGRTLRTAFLGDRLMAESIRFMPRRVVRAIAAAKMRH